VLVVHDQGAETSDSVLPALTNVLGHFDCTVTTVASADYRAGQAKGCDALIYLGLYPSTKLPSALLSDLRGGDLAVCWLGRNLDQLDQSSGLERYGFRLSARQPDGTYREVRHHNQTLERGDMLPVGIAVTDSSICHVLATLVGAGPAFPYAVRSGQFWYFADIPLTNVSPNGSHLVLCDELHEILRQEHEPRRAALLCIEGVDAQTDPDKVQGLTRYLAQEQVPFTISVTPVVADESTGQPIPLSRGRTLVGILREAQRAGAAVIADGSRYGPAGSSEDEGLREAREADRSSAQAGTAQAARRAVSELLKCGLFPLAWATRQGHDGDALERAAVAEHWSTVWERRRVGESGPEGQALPFLVEPGDHRQRVLPDNLPPLGKRTEVERILEQVRVYNNAVADPWLTIAVSPDADPEAVRMLVFELRAMRYDFADLRRMANWVESDSLRIYSQGKRQPLAALIPKGWSAALLGPPLRLRSGQAPGKLRSFERPNRDGRDSAALEPGAILLVYPPNQRPAQIFAFEGGPVAAADRLVELVAGVAMAIGVLIAGAFVFTYVAHLFLRRA
jgi:hypothetical protein